MEIIGLLIALVIAFFIKGDADSRGMNGWMWGIFTFLVCIITLPLYILVRKPHQY
jgi:hypothetical protein